METSVCKKGYLNECLYGGRADQLMSFHGLSTIATDMASQKVGTGTEARRRPSNHTSASKQ